MKNLQNKLRPLETRPYRYKKPATEFFCPLCRSPRAFASKPRLTKRHYLQMTIITVVIAAMLYPFMKYEGLFCIFIVWAAFEAGVRTNFRKEIPCPYCGFDASWYKRDVKVARRLVKEFWEIKNTPTETNQNELR